MNAVPNTDFPPQSVYLALGSNIRPERFIPLAVDELAKQFTICRVSSVWETPAEGFVGADFLNAIVHIQTNMTPVSLKYRILRPLEAQLGRVRTEHKYSPRTIDLDILIHGDEVLDNEIWYQPHLAVPLAELLPEMKHPSSGESMHQIARNFKNFTKISRREGILS